VSRADRVDGDSCGDRRVDPARQPDDDLLEAGLIEVVANPDGQHPPEPSDPLPVRERRRRVVAVPPLDDDVGLAERPHRGDLARGVDDERDAVEQDVVVAADLVGEHHRRVDRRRVAAEPLDPVGRLADVERARRQVQE